MALIDTVPSSSSAMAYMIGAVAFERGFTELYATLQEMCPADLADAQSLFIEEMHRSDSPVLAIAHKAVVNIYGGQCDIHQMQAALKGYMAESEDRFILRAAEIEVVRLQNDLSNLISDGHCNDGWSGGSDTFRR